MGKTILIVDDSATIRQVVGMTLKGAGYEVMEASDGKDALNKLDGKKINLIISDVNMPNMDGITFVKEAKKLARILSGKYNKGYVLICMAGMDYAAHLELMDYDVIDTAEHVVRNSWNKVMKK